MTTCALNTRHAAFLFPGVGVRLAGPELSIAQYHDRFFHLPLKTASEYAGVDFLEALRKQTIDTLSHRNRQIFTYAFSAGAGALALSLVSPKVAAGYSFGIYGALLTGDVIAFDAGLVVLDHAHRLMAEACSHALFGMGAVLGLPEDVLGEIIHAEQLSQTVRTNTNHALLHIFSGPAAEIDTLLACAASKGALKHQRLEVDIPYHHPDIQKRASEQIFPFLESIQWAAPRFPIVSSVDGSLMTTPDILKRFVADHLSSPLSWATVCDTLHSMNIELGIECGPGISLSQNARFLSFEMRMMNVKKAMRCTIR